MGDYTAAGHHGAEPSSGRRRPGRPRMNDNMSHGSNGESKRTRMRLAQRSYRSRKENALVVAKTRAEALKTALESVLDEFMKFHELASDRDQDLPADIKLQLNKTATSIMAISRKVRTEQAPSLSRIESPSDRAAEEPSTPFFEPSNHLSSHPGEHTGSTPLWQNGEASTHAEHIPVAQQFLRACLNRAASMLRFEQAPAMCLIPAMLLPLQFDGVSNLLARTVALLSVNTNSPSSHAQYTDIATKVMPRMVRLVEGRASSAVPRSSPPQLERLQFGMTRTALETAIPDLRGEWLEAVDVEEYLEQRGIFVRGNSPTHMLSLSASIATGLSSHANDLDLLPGTHDSLTALESLEDITVRDERSPSFNTLSALEKHHLSGYSHSKWANQVPQSWVPSKLDFTIFGQRRGEAQQVPSGLADFTPPEWFLNQDSPRPFEQTLQEQHGIRITIDLSKLIQGLADKAVCLGPCPGIRRDDIDEAIRGAVVGEFDTLV